MIVKGSQSQKGIQDLETAIALIAFVVMASVFVPDGQHGVR